MTHKEENIVNIAMKAAELLKNGKIEPSEMTGHMGMTEHIILLAEKFEQKYDGVDFNEGPRDYWLEIDEFAEKELLAEYGRELDVFKSSKQIPQQHLSLMNTLLSMTGDEIYDKFGYKRDEHITNTLYFDNGYQMDVKLVMCEGSETPYIDMILFDENGQEVTCEISENISMDRTFSIETKDAIYEGTIESLERSKGDAVKVNAVSPGGVKKELYSGDWDECKGFCINNDWRYLDENQFEWSLEIVDGRENSLPEGYYDALDHFNSENGGGDIECEHIRKHAEELVFCWQNGKSMLDFDFWTQYEELLGEKITDEEYSFLDFHYVGDPLELDKNDFLEIIGMRKALDLFRANKPDAEPAVKPKTSLTDKIHDAENRQAKQQGRVSDPKYPQYDFEDTQISYESYQGGVNNLTVCRTNPIGESPYQLTGKTVITTGTAPTEDVKKRHKQKLNRINRENRKKANIEQGR